MLDEEYDEKESVYCIYCGDLIDEPDEYMIEGRCLDCNTAYNAGRNAARAEVERLRGAWHRVQNEITKTRLWRTTTGMKTATDTSEFAALPPSALKALERYARAALGEEG